MSKRKSNQTFFKENLFFKHKMFTFVLSKLINPDN
jgi:hypothetical protein